MIDDRQRTVIEALRRRLDIRMNNHLIEMKPGYDDSIVGFNEAWDVVRGLLDEMASETN